MINRPFRIGSWRVDPALGRLSGPAGAEAIARRQMDLLCCFAAHPGEVLSKDELIERVWQGRVVTDSAVYWSVNQLRGVLEGDTGTTIIETVPKRGYRLVAEVQPLVAATTGRRHATVAAVVFTVLLGGIVLLWYDSKTAAVDRSIAVLPFENIGGDAADEAMVDGITEELLHAIANVDGLRVTARTSSFYFKDKRFDIRRIGQMLGVGHLVEGSVRRDDDRLRITVQLIDAADGTHVWSKVYDDDDLLTTQRDVAAAVARSLDVSLTAGDRLALAAAGGADRSLMAEYRAVRRIADDHSLPEADRALRQRELLESITARAPTFVPAVNALAMNHLMQISQRGGPFRENLDAAGHWLERLRELGQEDDWEYQLMLAIYERFQLSAWGQTPERVARTRAAYERAISLQPNALTPLLSYAIFSRRLGELQRAADLLEQAAALDPLNPGVNLQLARVLSATSGLQPAMYRVSMLEQYYPDSVLTYATAAEILASFGRFSDALGWLLRAPYSDNDHYLLWRLQAISLAMGNVDDAHTWMLRRELSPMQAAVMTGIETGWSAALHQGEQALVELAAPLDGDYELAGDIAWRAAEYRVARFHYEAAARDLRSGPPFAVNRQNHRRGIKLAAAWQQTGAGNSAHLLLDALEAWLTTHHRLGFEGHATALAEVLALSGRHDEALAELRSLFADGWQQVCGPWIDPCYGGEAPFLRPLAGLPGYAALREQAAAAMQQQRALAAAAAERLRMADTAGRTSATALLQGRTGANPR